VVSGRVYKQIYFIHYLLSIICYAVFVSSCFRAMQVDHQIFALCRLDVTGDNSDEIIACAWDGQTYILDQQRRSVRFQFEEPVRAFCAGNYNVTPGASSPSLVYNTFNNKVLTSHTVRID